MLMLPMQVVLIEAEECLVHGSSLWTILKNTYQNVVLSFERNEMEFLTLEGVFIVREFDNVVLQVAATLYTRCCVFLSTKVLEYCVDWDSEDSGTQDTFAAASLIFRCGALFGSIKAFFSSGNGRRLYYALKRIFTLH